VLGCCPAWQNSRLGLLAGALVVRPLKVTSMTAGAHVALLNKPNSRAVPSVYVSRNAESIT
jgi:hypothetical protein